MPCPFTVHSPQEGAIVLQSDVQCLLYQKCEHSAYDCVHCFQQSSLCVLICSDQTLLNSIERVFVLQSSTSFEENTHCQVNSVVRFMYYMSWCMRIESYEKVRKNCDPIFETGSIFQNWVPIFTLEELCCLIQKFCLENYQNLRNSDMFEGKISILKEILRKKVLFSVTMRWNSRQKPPFR